MLWTSTCAGILATAAVAAAQTLPLRRYDVPQGLANSRVNFLAQDSRGYLWIATWEGLSRFDGDEFVHFGTREGLGSDFIHATAEDGAGRMWVATADGSLSLFVGGAFRRFELPGHSASNPVRALCRDQSGGLWLASSAGVQHVDLDERGGLSIEPRHPDVIVTWPQAMVTTPDGQTWIGSRREVLEIVGAKVSRHVPPPDHDARGELIAIAPAQGGRVMVGFDRALYELGAPNEQGERAWTHVPLDFDELHHLRALACDRDGDVWIGSWQGLVRYRGEYRSTLLRREHGLADDSIRALCTDADGNVWIGTWSAGIARLSSKAIVHWTPENGLPDRTALFLAEDAKGRIVVTFIRSMARIDGDRVETIAGSQDPQWSGVGQRLLIDSRGEAWVGTDEPRFYHVPGPDLDLTRARAIGPAEGFPEGGVFGAPHEDPSGRVWVPMSSGDLAWFDAGREVGVIRFEHARLPPSERFSSAARCMTTTTSGQLWLAPYDGLARWIDGRLDTIEFEPGGPPPQSRCLHEDRSGNLWVGTRHAGVWLSCDSSAANPVFERQSISEGLVSHAVWSIAEDARGRLYFGTGRGIDRFDPSTGDMLHIGTREGLAGEIVNHCLTDRHGRIWVATSGGVSRIDPSIEDPPAAPPPVWITAVRVSGAEVAIDPRGVRQVDAGEHPSSENDVEIQFTAPCFRGESALAFQYRLSGVDSDWSPPTEQRSVHFARLDGGSYRFQVRAVHPAGTVSPSSAEVTFTIRPPLWRTPWFVAACVAVGGAIAYALHRSRVRRVLALERIRTQIATDIHDDMGSGLAQIAILSEVAKRQGAESARSHMDEIARLARSMRESMSDIVWSIDPRKDHFADLVQRMRQVAFNLLEAEGVAVEFDAPDEAMVDIPLGPDRRRHLLLMFKELVSNVARHAQASRVTVAIQVTPDVLSVSVVDDGRGFDTETPSRGHGLSGLKRRAEGLDARVRIESRRGAGTKALVEIKV